LKYSNCCYGRNRLPARPGTETKLMNQKAWTFDLPLELITLQ